MPWLQELPRGCLHPLPSALEASGMGAEVQNPELQDRMTVISSPELPVGLPETFAATATQFSFSAYFHYLHLPAGADPKSKSPRNFLKSCPDTFLKTPKLGELPLFYALPEHTSPWSVLHHFVLSG